MSSLYIDLESCWKVITFDIGKQNEGVKMFYTLLEENKNLAATVCVTLSRGQSMQLNEKRQLFQVSLEP